MGLTMPVISTVTIRLPPSSRVMTTSSPTPRPNWSAVSSLITASATGPTGPL